MGIIYSFCPGEAKKREGSTSYLPSDYGDLHRDGKPVFISSFTFQQTLNITLSKLKFRILFEVSLFVCRLNLTSLHHSVQGLTTYTKPICRFFCCQQFIFSHWFLSFPPVTIYTKYTRLTKVASIGILLTGDNLLYLRASSKLHYNQTLITLFLEDVTEGKKNSTGKANAKIFPAFRLLSACLATGDSNPRTSTPIYIIPVDHTRSQECISRTKCITGRYDMGVVTGRLCS